MTESARVELVQPPLGAHTPAGPFLRRRGCPFCERVSGDVLSAVRYQETQGANPDLPDVEGRLFACGECGVAYSSHIYALESFPALYHKDVASQDSFHRSLVHRVRARIVREILRSRGRAGSASELLDALFLRALLVPPFRQAPRGLRVLDVGCGYGDFTEAFRALGSEPEATEVLPKLVARLRAQGLACRYGELEHLDFGERRFDLVFLRGTLYRTRDPAAALTAARRLLAAGGELASVDPCPGRDGVEYFFRMQFPQGQFYVVDLPRYRAMLAARFGFRMEFARQIYGRPRTHLKAPGTLGIAIEFAELALNNLLHRRPHVLAYTLRPA
jgi:SAM-dependent methyltransferase